MQVRSIEARTHGRYAVRDGPPQRLLVGFHGYAETAEKHIAELLKIDGVDDWTVVAVQGLHPFYAMKTGEVVANWMTSLDRELAIADNIDYVRRVVASLAEPEQLVFCGFSQGAAMAYRAAAAHPTTAALLILGGDVPPDVTAPLPRVLIGRGERDDWYTSEKFEKDLRFLEGRAEVTTCAFAGGHEWSDEFRRAAGELLRSLTGQHVDESAR